MASRPGPQEPLGSEERKRRGNDRHNPVRRGITHTDRHGLDRLIRSNIGKVQRCPRLSAGLFPQGLQRRRQFTAVQVYPWRLLAPALARCP